MKALALLSTGLDSILAIKLIQQQNIEVIGLHFVSPFFGKTLSDIQKFSREIGIQIDLIDITNEMIQILKKPLYNYGRAINPCIDCHGLMVKKAVELLTKYNADFVITGEVIDQRPKSQQLGFMKTVSQLSTKSELILRPLSALNLEPTKPEILGWVDRSKLLAIKGRNRKTQMSLTNQFQIKSYTSPTGGCVLTEKGYAKKLKFILTELNDFPVELYPLIRVNRLFKIEKGVLLLVSRDRENAEKLENLFPLCKHTFEAIKKFPGPSMIAFGDITQKDLETIKQIIYRYTNNNDYKTIQYLYNGQIIDIGPYDKNELIETIKEYQILE